jgi:hypothetical protein
MKYVYDRLLSDEELRPHLERGDSVVFSGIAKAWQEIERQIGFGDNYAVSRTSVTGKNLIWGENTGLLRYFPESSAA